MQPLKITSHRRSAGEIVVFYAGNSLLQQVSTWADRHPACELRLCFAQSLSDIRAAARRAAVVLVDATEDPAQAMVALAQAMAELEAYSVAVYTETIHEGLELFVRARGALLLLGPMGDAPWEELFERMLQSNTEIPRFGFMKQRRAGRETRRATAGLWKPRSNQQHSAGSSRPRMRDWRR